MYSKRPGPGGFFQKPRGRRFCDSVCYLFLVISADILGVDELFAKSPARVRELFQAAKSATRQRKRREWADQNLVETRPDVVFTGVRETLPNRRGR